MERAFKFYKNEATYPNIRKVMEGKEPNNPNAHGHAKHMISWFKGPHVRRGNLSGTLYRGVPFHPNGNSLVNRSFTSWTPRLNKALRFRAGSRNGKPGVILVLNARKVNAYVRYNAGPPTGYTRVGGNTENEVLLPPGRMVLGHRNKGVAQVKTFGGVSKNVPYNLVHVKTYNTN